MNGSTGNKRCGMELGVRRDTHVSHPRDFCQRGPWSRGRPQGSFERGSGGRAPQIASASHMTAAVDS
jgi:hypothetical protein